MNETQGTVGYFQQVEEPVNNMKTIQQLLELAKNPHYHFMPDEQRVLNDFLAKQADSQSKTSQKKSSKESSQKTPVTVRNVVEKVDTYPPDSRRVDHSASNEKDDN